MAIRILSNDEYREFDNAYNNLPDNETRAEELGIQNILKARKINKQFRTKFNSSWSICC